MNLDNYVKANKKLHSIYYLGPPVEEIAKCIKLMCEALRDNLGFLCKEEIVTKIVKDIAELGISEDQVCQLLRMEIVH